MCLQDMTLYSVSTIWHWVLRIDIYHLLLTITMLMIWKYVCKYNEGNEEHNPFTCVIAIAYIVMRKIMKLCTEAKIDEL